MGGFGRRLLGLVAAASLVASAAVAIVGAVATPAGAVNANDDATFRSAFANASTTKIDLTGDILCSAVNGTRFSRNSATPIVIDGHGFKIDGTTCFQPSQVLLTQGSGKLTLINTTITGGTYTGICSIGGGGIQANTDLELDHSTVDGNQVISTNVGNPGGCVASGGGILVGGTATLRSSTISNNSATCATCANASAGGGIWTSPGTVVAINTTITGNSATAPASGFGGFGGGIYTSASTKLVYSTIVDNTAADSANIRTNNLDSFASVVANPISGPNCVRFSGTSFGYNSEELTSTCGFGGLNDYDFAPDPQLAPLANNGGLTKTRLPTGPSGVLINQVAGQDCAFDGATNVSTDQRDLVRPGAALLNCDIGAVEVPPAGVSGTYNAIPPVRVLDTRVGTGGLSGPFGPQQIRSFNATGVPGVPTSGTEAVIINVTAVSPTAAGWLTVFPFGAAVPPTANLNFAPGQTVPNLVVVKIGIGAKEVSIGNTVGLAGAGSVDVVADIVGFYADPGNANAFGKYTPITPFRALDTRTNTGLNGPFGPNESRSLDVTDVGVHVPDNAAAVVINVTATAATAPGWLTLYPGDAALPLAANVNFLAGETVPNLVVVGLHTGGLGTLNIANTDVPTLPHPPAGFAHVVGDIVGYFNDAAASTVIPMTPQRVLDTRVSGGPIGPNGTLTVDPHGAVGLPPAGSYKAVIVNITATGPTAAGWLTVYPSDAVLPLAANLNFLPGQNVPNLVKVGVGLDGTFKITNTDIPVPPAPNHPASGSVHVVVDIVGWYQ